MFSRPLVATTTLLVLSFSGPSLHAQGLIDARVVGMGGVGAAFADDSSAFLENPAGFTHIPKWRAEILPASFSFSDDLALTLSEFDQLVASADQGDKAAVQNSINNAVGRKLQANAAFFPNVTFKNWGVGLAVNANADGRIRNRAYTKLEGAVDASAELIGGYSYGFFDDVLSVGVSTTVGKRAKFSDVVGPASLARGDYGDRYRTLVRESFGMNFSLGAQIVSPAPWHLRLGIALKQLAGFNFDDPAPLVEGSRRLELSDEPTEAAVAVGASEEFGFLRLRFGIGHDDVTTTSSPFLHLHLGAETRFWSILALRGGITQGYFAAGVGVDLRYIRFEFATYGVERGVVAGQNQDRRYVFQMVLGI